MRRRPAAGAILALTCSGFSALSGHAQTDPASRAIGYLSAQQASDGSIDHSATETENLVLGAVAAGFDPNTLTSGAGHTAFDYLQAATASGAATADAGKTGMLILAVVAGRLDPSVFAGHDLMARLASLYHGDTGAYGDGATFGQALSILAVRAARQAPASAAVHFLGSNENTDGSWNFGSSAGGQGDTNSTSVALMALIAAGDVSHTGAALNYLHAQQNDDGGFPFQKPSPFGTPSDPDSDALVLQALTAAGEHPATGGWSKGGSTPLSNLRGMQDPASGGFTFPGNTSPDAFTTSQVPAGLELQPFPLTATFVSGSGRADQTARGEGALRFLAARQKDDGSVDDSGGETEDFVMGAAAALVDPATLRSAAGHGALDYLAAQTASGGADADAARTAKLILAVAAARLDPHAYAGTDLVARLAGFYDPVTGRYGGGETFTQSLSILAVRAAGGSPASAALSSLRLEQNPDGSWNFTLAPGPQGDTNSTAVALMALAAAGDHSRDASALGYLHSQQNSDGGFPFQKPSPFGTPSDPDSDALVLQALVAAFQDPAGAAWAPAGHTVLADLIALQDPSSGGFTFPGNSAPDSFTTSQVPAGLEREPFPILPTYAQGASLTPSPSPSPSPSASPPSSSSPSPSAASTPGPSGGVEALAQTGGGAPNGGPVALAVLIALGGVTVAVRRRRRRAPPR